MKQLLAYKEHLKSNQTTLIVTTINPDWRCMIGREDSPWYPTMRLFRQECPGDWASLLKQVEKALQTLVGDDKGARG